MIRTADAMMKAVEVAKAKERLAGSIEALENARAAGASEYVKLFEGWVEISRNEVARAEEFLRNPAW